MRWSTNKHLTGIGVSGDGDTASIGIGGFKHLVRRNVPMVYIVENNGVYGLTKGQFSATADKGQTLKYAGTNPYMPLDICLEALAANATFVARSFAGDAKQLEALLKAALSHNGLAVLDVISPCVTFNNHDDSTKSYTWGKEHEIQLHELNFIAALRGDHGRRLRRRDRSAAARRFVARAQEVGRGLRPDRQDAGLPDAGSRAPRPEAADGHLLHRAGNAQLQRPAEHGGRRRRGGRGRGRGRGRGEDGVTDETPDGAVRAEAPPATPAPATRAPRPAAADDEDLDVPPPSRAPRANPFGSVWDSQLGTPSASSAASRAPLVDEEDFEEPEIPEYLIAEQRRSGNRGGAGGGRGARGGRSAYQSAMERERYGRGGGGGGINRYPDVSGRTQQAPPPREDRGAGTERPPRTGAGRPWLERAMERRPARARGPAPGPGRAEAGSRPTCPGNGLDLRAGHRPGWRGGRGGRDGRIRIGRPEGSRHAQAGRREGDDRQGSSQAEGDPQASGRDRGRGRSRRIRRRAAMRRPSPPRSRGRPASLRPRRTRRPPTAARRCRAGSGAEAPDDAQGGGPGRTRLSTAMDKARTRGQAVALRAIAGMIRGPAPHAVLLVGPDGVGKTTLALDLAAGLLCTAAPAQRPCRECRACRLVDGRRHADLHRLGPVGPGRQVVIGGSDAKYRGVRDLIGELALMPAEGGRRVAIIEGAERMNEDAQSALLKTLEEPPAGVTIILCADGEAHLLPTVRSRCFRVRLGLVGPRDIEAIIADHGLADPPTAARLGRLAGGRPGLALAYARAPEAVLIRAELTRVLLDLTDARPSARLAAARATVPRALALLAALTPADPAAPAARPARRRGAPNAGAERSGAETVPRTTRPA